MVSGPIVIEIPPECKPLAEAVGDLLAIVKDARRASRGGRAVDCAELERAVGEATAKLERGAYESILSALDIDAPRVEIGGRVYNRLGRTRGTFRTMAGEVTVDRTVYREAGVRNGPTVDPIKLRLGTIGDGWLPQTARTMAFLLQQGTSREAEATSREFGRLPYSRNSFERVGHEVGAKYLELHADIEDALIREFETPPEARSVSVSLDRVSVPMEEPRKRPVGRPRKGAPKRPIERNYRMAYCGTVTLCDADGGALHTLRYGTMPANGGELLVAELANDVHQLLAARPDLDVVLLADGAPELWGLLDAELNEETLGKKPTRLIDFWHTVEKLAAAATAIHHEDAPLLTRRWRTNLKERSGAAAWILTELRRHSRGQPRWAAAEPVLEAITYLTNGQDRMNYAAAHGRGLPIGSGNVEATCKALVATRMKRPGSRWKTETGEHVIRLRALALSDRWDEAMAMFLATQRTSVRRAA